MFLFLGGCLIAIILALIAFNRAEKGKNFSVILIIGVVLYVLAIIGNMAGNKDTTMMLSYIASIVLLGIMFPVCKSKSK